MATWIEVADTAVKIGLSATVAGIGAYALARRNERHDFAKEFFRRRQDVIERVTTAFSGIHMVFFNICVDYLALRGALLPNVPISQPTRERYYKYSCDIGANLLEMHVLEGQLLVVGAEEATAALRRYRSHASDVNDMIQLDEPAHNKEQIQAALERLGQRRDDFYRAMSRPYKHG